MTLTITPAHLAGAVTPPPSKSQAHRCLIAAALAQGESVIENVAFSQDIQATLRCLAELGAEFDVEPARAGLEPVRAGLEPAPTKNENGVPARVTVRGMGANAMSPMRRMALPQMDCGESGSTLRFLIPIALATRGGGSFTGHGRLMERPQGPYEALFREKGIFWEQRHGVLTVQGLLEPGEYRLPGDVSSQFFTGLLYALPLLSGPSALIPTTFLESEGYVHMTLQAMSQFGVDFPATMSLPPQWHMPGHQTYAPAHVAVEADWSQAGFWYAARFLGNDVDIRGLNPDSIQGDAVIDAHYEEMGLELGSVGALELDVSGCPDLVPPLAAMAALRPGETTHLVNAARLRAKESDRLASVTAVLTALGAEVTEGPDFLTIRGRDTLQGGVTVDSFHDHRIAMMAAIAATRCERPVTLTGAESVNKSYPNFWEEYQRLGGIVTWNT